MNDRNYTFRQPSAIKIRIAADVTPFELGHALTGTHLTVSNYPGGGFIIHRIPHDVDRSRPTIHCDAPPEPPRAA